MLNAEERRLYFHQCGGGGGQRRHGVLAGPESSSSGTTSSRSLAALKVTRKYRQAAVRRREYRKLKAIVPAVSAKHAVSKVRMPASINRSSSSTNSSQGRINHCSGCTMGAPPRRQGAPDQPHVG